MGKKKKAVSTEQVRHLYAPQYKDISVASILEFAANFEQLTEYFPAPRDIPLLPR